jgi:hypothetical protein
MIKLANTSFDSLYACDSTNPTNTVDCWVIKVSTQAYTTYPMLCYQRGLNSDIVIPGVEKFKQYMISESGLTMSETTISLVAPSIAFVVLLFIVILAIYWYNRGYINTYSGIY